MKRKDIIYQLKNKADLEMTDIINKIDLNSINIEEPQESIKNPFNLRKTFIYTFASLFIFVSGFLLFSLVINPIVDNPTPLASETEIAGFQTVTAASLLTSFDIEALSYQQEGALVSELSQSSFVLENELYLVNSYLNMAETSIGNEDNFVYLAVESDLEAYTYAFEYRSMDLSGNLIEYKGYYNIKENNGNSVENGILVHNQKSYAYSSFVEQTESGNIKRYQVYLDQQNYVEVVNYSNESVQKFSYKIYKAGELDNTSNITIKSNHQNLEANIEIINKQGNEIYLDLYRDTENATQQYFHVNYTYNKNNQSNTGEFTVNLTLDNVSGKYQYQYNYNNQTLVENRVEKGNKKASDDDFNTTNYQANSSQNTDGTQGKKTENNGNKKNNIKKTNDLTSNI